MKRCCVLFAWFVLVPWLPCEPMAQAQPPADRGEAKDRVVLKVYQVVDLLVPSPNYPYRGTDLPTTGGMQSYRGGAQSLGGGGGGGGFFQVPPERSFLAQRGKPGAAGGQGMGEGMAIGGIESESPGGVGLRFGIEDLIEAIVAVVSPGSWDELGGPGTIRSLGSMLLVNQTEVAHKGIEHLLNEIRAQGGAVRTVTIVARWLALDDAQRSQLTPEGNGKPAVVVDRNALKKLAADATRYQGQVTCHSGQTVHIVSGTRHSVVTSAIPVVGGQGTGYQPVVAFPNAGVLLQVTPLLLSGGKAASLDVQSSVTAWQAPESLTVAAGETSLAIDRVRLAANQLATTVRIPLGKPVLVGGLTPSDADAVQKTLYLVLELTLDEEMTPAPGNK